MNHIFNFKNKGQMILTIILFSFISQLLLNAYFLFPPSGGMELKEAYMHLGKAVFRGVCWSSIFALFISFTRGGTRVIFALYSVLYLALLSIEVILLCEQNMIYNQSAALIFLASNPQETAQFLDSTLSLSAFLLPITGLLLSFFAVHGLSGLIRSHLRIRSRMAQIALCVTVIFGFVPTFYLAWSNAMNGFGSRSYQLSTIDRMIWSTFGAIREGQMLEEYIKMNSNTAKGQITSISETRPHRIVVIIGESLRRDYLHAYGYPLSTTPHIDSLIASGNMVAMDDVLSPASITLKSVTHLMTFKRTTDGSPWYTYPTLSLMLQEAGYYTRWISNQESKGFYAQPLTAIANQSKEVYFTNRPSIQDDENVTKIIYDEELLNIFDGLQTLDSVRYCDVYHLQGSHYTYTSRYPKTYDRFRGEDVKRIHPDSKLADWKYQRIAEYDNSILYNDYVIKEIIRRYEKTPTIIFYLSDHGEVLFDDPNHPEYLGHGREPILKIVSIPMLVYVSPAMQVLRPDILPRIQAAKSKRFMSDLLPNSILDLMGITSPLVKPSEALFSNEYDESRPRYIIHNGTSEEPASLLLD